jgi:hypothetical protein
MSTGRLEFEFSRYDHPIVREGIAGLVATQPDMILVGEASDGREAIQQFRIIAPTLPSWMCKCRK